MKKINSITRARSDPALGYKAGRPRTRRRSRAITICPPAHAVVFAAPDKSAPAASLWYHAAGIFIRVFMTATVINSASEASEIAAPSIKPGGV